MTERTMDDQKRTDHFVYYRNLAIILGAKPNQMVNDFDAALARNPSNVEHGGEPSTRECITEVEDIWERAERTGYYGAAAPSGPPPGDPRMDDLVHAICDKWAAATGNEHYKSFTSVGWECLNIVLRALHPVEPPPGDPPDEDAQAEYDAILAAFQATTYTHEQWMAFRAALADFQFAYAKAGQAEGEREIARLRKALEDVIDADTSPQCADGGCSPTCIATAALAVAPPEGSAP
jgi:hypothetical protein